MANGNGTVSIWLAVVAFLLAGVSSLLSLLYRRDRSDHKALREEIRRLAAEAVRFDRFAVAVDVRDKVWQEQRIELISEVRAMDKRIRDLLQAEADWKHKRLAPRLNRLLLEIVRIKDKLGLAQEINDDSGT